MTDKIDETKITEENVKETPQEVVGENVEEVTEEKVKEVVKETVVEKETAVEKPKKETETVENAVETEEKTIEEETTDIETKELELEKPETKEPETEKPETKEPETKEPTAEDQGIVVINDDVPDEAKWYVVHTYAGHEEKVAVNLKQRANANGFTDRVFKIFIPHQQKIVISEGKKRSVDERLFPGYVIVLMTMSDDSWLLVRSTRGVTGFVGMGSTPTPLPKQEVKTLMKFTKMEAPKFEAKYSVGDSVKIMEGPFRDFLGKVDEVNEDQGKVKVLISFFGKETPVELDFVQVQNL